MEREKGMTNEAFEAFYLKHYKFVYRIAYSYMKEPHDAEDVTEDVFVKVLTGSFSFESEEHEKSWLALTTMNRAKDVLKSAWRKQVGSLEDLENEPESPESAAAEASDTMEAIQKLDPKYKEVIILFYYMGYKTDEIAEKLRKPPSTVRNLLADARKKLRVMLEHAR